MHLNSGIITVWISGHHYYRWMRNNYGFASSSWLMNMQQLVIPAKAGIQSSGNPLKILDSSFHGNDEIMPFSGYYESIMVATMPEFLR
jgi:hypothetical protein